jgi:phosphatidylinositol glycan class A protein
MRIALISDFFYPRLGGVEMHIYSLAQRLIAQGHKVIVITHAYHTPTTNDENKISISKRTGVRYLPGPLKVYYCPIIPMTDQDALPTFSATLPIMRYIWIRERIQIVHAHQATSTLANESIAYAAEMGLASVYTDHSLFGFDDLASVILNRVMKATLSTVNAIICVSHTCRENLIMRANIDPTIVHAIPNAIDANKFTPAVTMRCTERIKIVIVSRLVYRKGVDLLVGIIPKICAQFDNVDFIIGGDGTKKLALEEMVERERLQERVEFLGSVPHSQVRNVLVRGHIFLNCSLTESFCIAILEAASCGLFVVSTEVGGVPEVLPSDLISMGKPDVEELTLVLATAIREKIVGGAKITFASTYDPLEAHARISKMYSWDRVAARTVKIYEKVLQKKRLTFLQRLARYKTVGSFSGYIVCLIAISLHFLLGIIELLQPRNQIDVVPDLEPFDAQELLQLVHSNQRGKTIDIIRG